MNTNKFNQTDGRQRSVNFSDCGCAYGDNGHLLCSELSSLTEQSIGVSNRDLYGLLLLLGLIGLNGQKP